MEKLLSLMKQIENPGTFAVGGKLTALSPGLKIKDLGMISMPILPAQAQALIQVSEQAPYGRGEDTVVDTQVRQVWQISAENFTLTNVEWLEALQKSIQEMGRQLGLDGCKINFEAYKLLIYEKDSFFVAHRDTEKIPNMFATLVINLPSIHEGGELIVTHGGKTQNYCFAENDGLHPDFVTFYADCYHEVKPVISGYRICLIYNLAIANRKQQPRLVEQIAMNQQIKLCLQEWQQGTREPPMLTYLLQHSYSEQNLCLENLKNGDFAKASVLLKSAIENHCEAYLCLVTYFRSSYGDVSSYGYDDDDMDENDFDECDISDEELYVHGFSSLNGEKLAIGRINLDEDDLLAEIPLLEGEGRECEISEATGNEGATKELWYHRGAIVIWSPEDIFKIATQADDAYRIAIFKRIINENLLTSENQTQIKQLVTAIIERQSSENITEELIALGDTDLLKKLLHKQMQGYDFRSVKNEAFLRIAAFCGWEFIENEIAQYLTSKRDAMRWLNELLFLKSLPVDGKAMIKKWTLSLWQTHFETHSIAKELEIALEMIGLLSLDSVVDETLAILTKETQAFFSTRIYGENLIKALNKMQGYDYDKAIMQRFIAQASQWIQNDYPEPPEKHMDATRSTQLNCNCEFCKKVNQFLVSPYETEMKIYKTLKRNLTHVETEINKVNADVSIAIVKVSSSFQGNCRKTQKSYQQQLQLYNLAQKMLADLQLAINS